jgi:hypothetical protein
VRRAIVSAVRQKPELNQGIELLRVCRDLFPVGVELIGDLTETLLVLQLGGNVFHLAAALDERMRNKKGRRSSNSLL